MIAFDIPIDAYHAGPEVSCTALHALARSPFHYWAAYLSEQREHRAETSAQLAGNLAHCAILEPDKFDARYIVGPVDDKRLKAWRAFEEALPAGVTPIKPSEHEAAMAQAAAAATHPELGRLLSRGRPEVSAYWIDEATGTACRCRPDWVHPIDGAGVILVDVKTYSTADPKDFERQVSRMGYHRQAAFYSDGYTLASGEPVLGFIFAAVEVSYPYAVSLCMLDEESLECGRQEVRQLLDLRARCIVENRWPAFGDGVELIRLANWARTTPTTTAEDSQA